MKIKESLKIIFFTILLSCFFTATAWANTNYHKHMVAFTDTDIPLHAVAKHVVVIGGNVHIAGTVTDEVVVLDGDVTLKNTARITDRVVVIGGNVLTEDGAKIGKGIFRLGGHLNRTNGLATAIFLLALLWFAKLAISLILILIPTILAWGWGRQAEELSEIIDHGIIKTIVAGMLGYMAILLVDALLIISVIGIPVALIGSILVLLATALGFSGLCLSVSRCISFNRPDSNSIFVSTLYGSVLLVLTINMPLVGFLVLLLSGAVSFGGVIMKIFNQHYGKN